MNRRKFLQIATVTTAAFACQSVGKGGLRPAIANQESPLSQGGGKAMLIDIPKCIGCGMCSAACQEENNLSTKNPGQLDDETWTVINSFSVTVDGKQEKRYVKNQCFHCMEPACVSACLVGALVKSPEGPVVYDGDKCMGCRYCMIACPFDIPKYQWDSPFPLLRKCVFCRERLMAGEEPACATACPTEATIFGTREELINEATKRIEENLHIYIPHIYGLEEVGGTSMLYLSDVPFEELGFPMNLGTKPLSVYTWAALSKVPAVVGGGALFLGAAYKLSQGRGDKDEA